MTAKRFVLGGLALAAALITGACTAIAPHQSGTYVSNASNQVVPSSHPGPPPVTKATPKPTAKATIVHPTLKPKPPVKPVNTHPHLVYVLGDSLTVRMKNAGLRQSFADQNWHSVISGVVGRAVAANSPSPSGLVQAGMDTASIKGASAVVLELGTNPQDGSTSDFAQDWKTLVGRIRVDNPKAHIYWVNIGNFDAPLVAENNRRDSLMTTLAPQWNVKIIDWRSVIMPHPEWVNGDPMRIHPNADDTQVMIHLVVSSVTNN